MRRRLIALLLLVPALAFAAVTPTPVFTQNPKFPHLQITNANNLTAQTLFVCGTGAGAASKITGIWATSTDGTLAHDVVLSVLNTSTYNLTTVTVPINAGSIAATPPVNMMSSVVWPGLPTDSDGNPYYYCASGDTLQAAVLVQITAAKFVNIELVASEF